MQQISEPFPVNESAARTLSSEYTIQYHRDTRWWTLKAKNGGRIELSPETARKLRDVLNEVLPPGGDVHGR
jgi:hypothetical protein